MADNPQSSEAPAARREWSDIQQGGRRRSTSGVALRRKWLRIGRWAGMVALAAGVLGAAAYSFHSASKDRSALEPSASLDNVAFHTDGVLDLNWLVKVLDLKQSIALSGLDLPFLRAKLEAQGQVKSASVTLRLPDRLLVDVRERMPIMRARAQVAANDVRTLLIARDGTVFEGYGYPANTIRALPHIDGVTLRLKRDGYESLGDLEPVALLLDRARVGWPKLYTDWRTVSFTRYRGPESAVSYVEMGSRTMGTIIFSIHNVDDQLRRLEKIVQEGAAKDPRPILRVDLSIPGMATVEYEKSTSKSTTKGKAK